MASASNENFKLENLFGVKGKGTHSIPSSYISTPTAY